MKRKMTVVVINQSINQSILWRHAHAISYGFDPADSPRVYRGECI